MKLYLLDRKPNGLERFRRVNPAASLKLQAVDAQTEPRRRRFRRVNPAASLKPGFLQQLFRLVAGFRRVNPAASLKLVEQAPDQPLGSAVSAG